MRPVARIERDRENVGCAIGKLLRGLAQAAGADVTHQGIARDRGEGPGQVVGGDLAAYRDVIERDRLAQAAFDQPDCFLSWVHEAKSSKRRFGSLDSSCACPARSKVRKCPPPTLTTVADFARPRRDGRP